MSIHFFAALLNDVHECKNGVANIHIAEKRDADAKKGGKRAKKGENNRPFDHDRNSLNQCQSDSDVSIDALKLENFYSEVKNIHIAKKRYPDPKKGGK